MALPKISIVTPCFNADEFIEETITSVLDQGYPNLEYIIIDGGSTDRTLKIIKRYEHRLTHWISEPDRGQAHAINKGISLATGDIFNWINADDILADNALSLVAAHWRPDNVLATNVANFTKFNETSSYQTIRNHNLEFLGRGLDSSKAIFHQPGLWASLSTVKELYPLDESLHFCFDTSFYTRVMLNQTKVRYIDKVTVFFRIHECSKSVKDRKLFFHEKTVGLVRLLCHEEISADKRFLLSIACINNLFMAQHEFLLQDRPFAGKSLFSVGLRSLFWIWRHTTAILCKPILFRSW